MTESRDLSVLPENLGPRLMGLSEGTNSGNNGNPNGKSGVSLTYVSPSLKISTDPRLVAHGRGLVAAAPIQAGELLFVHPPTVKAEISQVLRIYKNKAGSRNGSENNKDLSSSSSSSSLLESIAETVLLKEMKRAVRGRKKESSARMAASFLALNSNHSTRNEADEAETNTGNSSEIDEETDRRLMQVLLGMGEAEDAERILTECDAAIDNNDYLLGIIRHNAFGPDFHHYHRMESELLNNNSAGSAFYYSRILGHYPLAAMINHSCGPTNATRVFYKETMVATATQAIPSGKEILWPYCPPISPFPDRNQQLKNCYGFSCRSNRSVLEERAYGIGIPPPKIPVGLGRGAGGGGIDAQLHLQQWAKILKSLEVWYKVVAAKIELPTTSNNGNTQNVEDPQQQQHQLLLLQHSLRLGYTHLYIRYFNEALQQQMHHSQPESVRANILREANELHSAFSTVHNACTEHLSLLHLCYELSATTTTTIIDNDKRDAIQFWTEELKEAHLCRYSNEVVGRDLATLRKALKHSRTVLRTRDGWKNSDSQNGVNSFI
jgi:hypothetical protein